MIRPPLLPLQFGNFILGIVVFCPVIHFFYDYIGNCAEFIIKRLLFSGRHSIKSVLRFVQAYYICVIGFGGGYFAPALMYGYDITSYMPVSHNHTYNILVLRVNSITVNIIKN